MGRVIYRSTCELSWCDGSDWVSSGDFENVATTKIDDKNQRKLLKRVGTPKDVVAVYFTCEER